MSKLFTFLENFDPDIPVKITDRNGQVIYEGLAGDVPQRITNETSVDRGRVVIADNTVVIMVM